MTNVDKNDNVALSVPAQNQIISYIQMDKHLETHYGGNYAKQEEEARGRD